MGNILVIDGHNLLLRLPGRGGRLAGINNFRLPLARIIAHAYPNREVVLVFDGTKRAKYLKLAKTRQVGTVRVRYSRPPDEADDVIVRLCSDHNSHVEVVTSDKGLIERVEDYLASDPISTQDFATRLQELQPERWGDLIRHLTELAPGSGNVNIDLAPSLRVGSITEYGRQRPLKTERPKKKQYPPPVIILELQAPK